MPLIMETVCLIHTLSNYCPRDNENGKQDCQNGFLPALDRASSESGSNSAGVPGSPASLTAIA
jgi:hypothetical protein